MHKKRSKFLFLAWQTEEWLSHRSQSWIHSLRPGVWHREGWQCWAEGPTPIPPTRLTGKRTELPFGNTHLPPQPTQSSKAPTSAAQLYNRGIWMEGEGGCWVLQLHMAGKTPGKREKVAEEHQQCKSVPRFPLAGWRAAVRVVLASGVASGL